FVLSCLLSVLRIERAFMRPVRKGSDLLTSSPHREEETQEARAPFTSPQEGLLPDAEKHPDPGLRRDDVTGVGADFTSGSVTPTKVGVQTRALHGSPARFRNMSQWGEVG